MTNDDSRHGYGPHRLIPTASARYLDNVMETLLGANGPRWSREALRELWRGSRGLCLVADRHENARATASVSRPPRVHAAWGWVETWQPQTQQPRCSKLRQFGIFSTTSAAF